MARIEVSEFLNEYDDTWFPPDFLSGYEVLELLSQSRFSETFLIKRKNDGMLYVAKCYDRQSYPAAGTESDILSNLNHEGLPKFISSYENDRSIVVIRE